MMDQISKTVCRSDQFLSDQLLQPNSLSVYSINTCHRNISVQISTCAHNEHSDQNALFDRSLCWALLIIKY